MNDETLNIKTEKVQKGSDESPHYNRYEPTPYSALEILFDHFELRSNDRVVDFGCGKGRLNFFIHHHFGSTVTGIEMNEFFYKEALKNRSRYSKKLKGSEDRIHFHCCLAQDYVIDPLDNVFYFFNPFSIQIFINVVNNISHSVETAEREVKLVLYYVSEDYVFFLENQTAFKLEKEIILPGNAYDKFLIYSLGDSSPQRER